MPTYIALLRGINLGKHYKLNMGELKTMFENIGFESVRTHLQSGNVVFESSEPKTSSLENTIERAVFETFGYSVPTLIRISSDLQRITASNPFPLQTTANPIQPYVIFLKNQPKTRILELPASESAEHQFGELEIFVHYPNGSQASKLSNNYVENKLETMASTRNWRTVLALLEMTTT
jgi:uncharacterized protein (DUF1697 family)